MSEAFNLPKGLKGLATAKVWGSSQYLTPGKYLLKVKSFKQQDSHNPKKSGSSYFIVAFDVVVATYKNGQETKFSQGDEVSWIVDTAQPSARSNIVQFLTGCFPEMVQKDLSDEFLESLFVLDPPPGIGRELIADAFEIKTGSEGEGRFTKITWALFDEKMKAEMAAKAAATQQSAA